MPHGGAAGGGVVLPRAKISEEALLRAPLIPGVTTDVKKEGGEGTKGKKELIPVVSHVITDDQVGGLPGVKMQPVNMNKTIKLLTDPHSAMLYDRHVNALRKIVKHYRQGFLMKDLVQVFKILRYTTRVVPLNLQLCSSKINNESSVRICRSYTQRLRGPGGGTTLLRRAHVRHIKAVHAALSLRASIGRVFLRADIDGGRLAAGISHARS